jgi:hypothetical protein
MILEQFFFLHSGIFFASPQFLQADSISLFVKFAAPLVLPLVIQGKWYFSRLSERKITTLS